MFVKEGKLTDFVTEFPMEQMGCPKEFSQKRYILLSHISGRLIVLSAGGGRCQL